MGVLGRLGGMGLGMLVGISIDAHLFSSSVVLFG